MLVVCAIMAYVGSKVTDSDGVPFAKKYRVAQVN